MDRDFLSSQMSEGIIFSAFPEDERQRIWRRLSRHQPLILTLYTFFKDIVYVQLLIDCLKRLIKLPRGESISEFIQGAYKGQEQKKGQVKIQVGDGKFFYRPGNKAARKELGWRQLVAFAMRNYPDLPRDPVKEDTTRKATAKADPAILCQEAELAYQLGFDTPEIRGLRQDLDSRPIRHEHYELSPLDVTSGPGVQRAQRYGTPRAQAYEEVRNSLFLDNLDRNSRHFGDGITSFFIRKSIYQAFFLNTSVNNENTSYPSSPSSGGSPAHSIRSEVDSIQSHIEPERMDEDTNNTAQVHIHQEDIHNSQEERLLQARQEHLRQERLAQVAVEVEQQRLEQERLAQVAVQERLAQERLEEREDERQSCENKIVREGVDFIADQISLNQDPPITITYMVPENGGWREAQTVTVKASDPSHIERIASKYERKFFRSFDFELNPLTADECFARVTGNSSNTIFLMPMQSGVKIGEELENSVSQLLEDRQSSLRQSYNPGDISEPEDRPSKKLTRN